MKAGIGGAALISLSIALSAQQPRFDGRSWLGHVNVLADDAMEGRGIGTAGLQRAEAYVVDRVQKAGMLPAGVDGYYQPVRFESRRIVERDSDAVLVRDGKAEPLVLGEDAYFSALLDPAPSVDAPLVFVGYGLQIPEKNYDDFAGLSMKGKVAVAIPAAPTGMDGAIAVLANRRRQQQYPELGLAGWVWLTPPSDGWTSEVAAARFPSMSLPNPANAKQRQIRLSLQSQRAERLFEGTGHTPAELLALAAQHKPLPRFELKASIRTHTRAIKTVVESANVLAKLEGSDPKLKHEYIVLSAHIDHLGIGDAVKGDTIYNGAIDNASGVSALIDIADAFKRSRVRPKRSILLAFFTGEEKGMLGSKYFMQHPTVNVHSIVANVNVDSIYAFIPLTSILVLGQDDSTLGDASARAIASQHVSVVRDPNNRGICCSDQYSFIEHDIPAVRLDVDESNKVIQDWLRDRVHKPSDDPGQPMEIQAAATYEEIIWRLLIDVANDDIRPAWKDTSVYHQRFAAK